MLPHCLIRTPIPGLNVPVKPEVPRRGFSVAIRCHLQAVVVQDLRHGIRLAVRKPGFALLAISMLSLGIAVNSAMFSVLNTLLFHTLPYRDASRILAVDQANPERGLKQQLVSIPDYFDWWARP